MWVGEFGSGLDLYNPNPAYNTQLDAAFIGNLSDLINDGSAYLHPSLPNWNWWCWNANTVRAAGSFSLSGLTSRRMDSWLMRSQAAALIRCALQNGGLNLVGIQPYSPTGFTLGATTTENLVRPCCQ